MLPRVFSVMVTQPKSRSESRNIRCVGLDSHFSHSFVSSAVMAFPEVVSDASGIDDPARAFLAVTVPVDSGARLIHLARFGSASSPPRRIP
jgi:hypothetical protein